MHTLHKTRATLYFFGDVVFKVYADPGVAKIEVDWYRQLPDGIPPMLMDADPDNGVLVMERLGTPAPRPADLTISALAEALEELERRHIHHRDIHPGNVVVDAHGKPRIVDWETAIHADAPSYDLHGPSELVPAPDIHKCLPTSYEMFWNSDHWASIKSLWGVRYVPT
ncbi:serine/threonine kinase [Mycobacterium phage Squint]|nr:serine/threonine kinase [Mycobacterium phage Squint]